MVGSSFERIVYDVKKNVLVRFYAPWDGKSADFEASYVEVATEFMFDSSVLFADFDQTKNEVDGFEFDHFPVFVLFKAGGNGREHVKYEGPLEKEALKQFVQTNMVRFEESELCLVCCEHAVSSVLLEQWKRGNQMADFGESDYSASNSTRMCKSAGSGEQRSWASRLESAVYTIFSIVGTAFMVGIWKWKITDSFSCTRYSKRTLICTRR